MNRAEALELADKMVAGWTGQTKNERGYVHDKWQPTPLPGRTDAVLKLAAFLLGDEGPVGSNDDQIRHTVQQIRTKLAEQHTHRASCDDTGGNHICGHP